MPTQVEKLQGYAGHLLDDMILLREKYSMLRPMLFDADINKAWGHDRIRGFTTLRTTLFFSCAQDVVKIAADRDQRTPSVHNIVERLPAVRDELREQFAAWSLPISDEDDPEVWEAIKRFERAEQEDRTKQFDTLYTDLFERWGAFLGSSALQGMRTIRNKVSAHTEIRHHVDKYVRVDLGTLGLKWRDLGVLIDQLQELVELAGLVTRNAGFAWDSLDENTTAAATAFWTPFADDEETKAVTS